MKKKKKKSSESEVRNVKYLFVLFVISLPVVVVTDSSLFIPVEQ